MITNFKIFEREEKNIIYRCPDFKIEDDFGYTSIYVASYSVLSQLPELIKNKNKYIEDINLKNIELTYKRTINFKDHLLLDNTKIKNMKEHKTGVMRNFLYKNEREDLESVSSNVYIQLIFKYYPIIENIIDNSKTIGDVIIEYKKLIPKINDDLELYSQTNKYNL